MADKDVVFGFGFHLYVELLNAQVDFGHDLLDPGQFEVQPCSRDAHKPAEPLHDRRLGRRHRKQPGKKRADSEKDKQHEEKSHEPCHGCPP